MVGNRRALLAAAPLLALSACGKATEAPEEEDPNVDTGTQKQGDIDLLTALLEADEPVGPPTGTAAVRPLARALADDAAAHKQTLTQAIAALGGRIAPYARPARDEPFDPAEVLGIIERSVAMYLDFVPKLSDGRVRALTAAILADKAARAAQLRLLLDQPPVPEAFVA